MYVKTWIRSPIVAKATLQDLTFLLNFYLYKDINEAISNSAFQKFCNHLYIFHLNRPYPFLT